MVDHLLASSIGELCRVFICDGEGCNAVLRRAILGNLTLEEKRRVQSLSWFSRLKHTKVPGLGKFPRWHVRACTIDGEPIFYLQGVAHAVKNACSQATSTIRILHCGWYWVDAAGALKNNIPLPAYKRADAMSDRLAALFNCPMFLANEVDS